MDTRRANLLSNRERMKNELEVKLLLKSAKINNNIINSRNKAREELHRKFKQREKRTEIARIASDLMKQNKINYIKNRQMSRDIRDIQYRFQSINPIYNNNNVYDKSYINNNQKNYEYKYYSSNRRKYIDDIKNKFYNKNTALKGNNDIINELNKIDNDFISNNSPLKINNNNYYRNNNYYNNDDYNEQLNIENNENIYREKNYINNDIIGNNGNSQYNEEQERKKKLQMIFDNYKDK